MTNSRPRSILFIWSDCQSLALFLLIILPLLDLFYSANAQQIDVDDLRAACRLDCEQLLVALPNPDKNFDECDWKCKKQQCKSGCDLWNTDVDCSKTCAAKVNYTCATGCHVAEARKLFTIQNVIRNAVARNKEVSLKGVDISWELKDTNIVGVYWDVEMRQMDNITNSTWSPGNSNIGSAGANILTISVSNEQLFPLSEYQFRLVAFYRYNRVGVSNSITLTTRSFGKAPLKVPIIIQQAFLPNSNTFIVCWKLENDQDKFMVVVEDSKKATLFNDTVSSQCKSVAQLKSGQSYTISVTRVDASGSSSQPTVLDIKVFQTNFPTPVLYFSNSTHISKIEDINDSLSDTKIVYSSKSPLQIKSFKTVSNDLLVYHNDGSFAMVRANSQLSPIWKLSNVKLILRDELNDKFYVFTEKEIFQCELSQPNCYSFFTLPQSTFFSAAISVITGYIYFSTQDGVYRMITGNGGSLEKFDVFRYHPCNLAVNHVTTQLICNAKEKTVLYDLLSKIISVKSDHLRAGTERSYSNVTKMVSYLDRLIWITNPCKEPSSENSCLFSDDSDPRANGMFNINNYLIPLGHGTLVDLDLAYSNQLTSVLFPPSNVSMFFSSSALRVSWQYPERMDFQAPGLWPNYSFQLELLSDSLSSKQVVMTNKLEHFFNHGTLKEHQKFVLKLRTCRDEFTCSQSVEMSGWTFGDDLPLRSTDLLILSSNSISSFTLLGNRTYQTFTPNQYGNNALIAGNRQDGITILTKDGTLLSFEPQKLAKPFRSGMLNVSAMASEQLGSKIYWSQMDGIYRSSLVIDDREILFPESDARFLKLLINEPVIIVGTSSNVYSLLLTGGYYNSYFSCQSQTCEVLGVMGYGKTISYAYRSASSFVLETTTVDGSSRKTVTNNLPANIKKIDYMYGKYLILTDDSRLAIFDPVEASLSYLPPSDVRDFCFINIEETLIAPYFPQVTSVNFVTEKDGDEFLVWTVKDDSKAKSASRTFFKVSVYDPKGDGSVLSETLTDSMNFDLTGLSLSEINVTMTVFNYWRSNMTSSIVKPPLAKPSRPKNPRIYSSLTKSPYNKTSSVLFLWDSPIWNGAPAEYEVLCSSTTSTPQSPRIVAPTVSFVTIDNLPLDINYSCRIKAKNLENGYGLSTDSVSVSSNENNPAPLLLLADQKYFSLYDTDKNDFVQKSPGSLFTSVVQMRSRVIVIEKRSNVFRTLIADGNSIGNISEIKTGLNATTTQITSMAVDWVSNSLYLAGSEYANFDQKSSIWYLNLDDNKPAERIQQYEYFSSNPIGKLAFDPFSSSLYFTQCTGVKCKLYSMKVQPPSTPKQSLCPIVSPAITVDFSGFNTDALGKRPVLALSSDGVIDIDGCRDIIQTKKYFNFPVENVIDLAIDVKQMYFVTGSEIFILDQKSKSTRQIDLSVKDISVFVPSLQPYPDISCLKFPIGIQNISARQVDDTSAEILLSDILYPVSCGHISRPVPKYVVTVKPTSDAVCELPRCLKQESTNSVITFHNLQTNTEYQVNVIWYNEFNDKRAMSDPIRFNTKIESDSAPRDLRAFSMTPRKLQLYWLPSVKYVGNKQIKYAVAPVSDIGDNNDPLDFSITCPTVPCNFVINKNVMPATNYSYVVYAKNQQQSDEEANAARSNIFTIRTFNEPGRLSELQANKSSNSLTFVWLREKSDTSKGVRFSYKKLNEVNWKPFPPKLQQAEGELYIVDGLDADSQYSVQYTATYNNKYSYDNKELPPANEDYSVVSTSATLAVNEKPQAPQNLQFTKIGNDSYLNWTKPFDGGKPILSYMIEYKNSIKNNWTVAEFGQLHALQTVVKIPERFAVTPNTQFRVMARNVNGWSEPSIVTVSDVSSKSVTSKPSITGIIVAVVLVILLLFSVAVVYFAVRRRRVKKPTMSRQVANDSNYRMPRNENASEETLKQISPEDMKTLPHVPRSCITINKLLGSGAFGEVFEGLAYNLPTTGQKSVRVAVKTLRPGSAEVDRVKFLKEAVLMTNLKHPNILRLLGVCLESEPHWIVLELMEGGELLHYLRSVRPTETMPSQVSLRDLLHIALDIAKGCRYLEQMHHVHRDLATRNCLISSRDPALRVVKLADFGLSRDVYEGDYYRVEGHGLLPVRWMGPECLIDGIFTIKSDVWSFGILLWEIMTLGKQPYAGKTNWDVMNLVRLGGRLEKPECCLDEIYQIMIFCWAFDAAARPSFAEIVEKLLTLTKLDQFIDDSPFPPFYSRNSSQPTSPENSINLHHHSQSEIITPIPSSEHFKRRSPETQSSGQTNKTKGSSFFSLRKKKEQMPPPQLPTKQELDALSSRSSNVSQQSQLRPDSGISGASITTTAQGYEVPLLKNVSPSVKYTIGSQNPAYQSDVAGIERITVEKPSVTKRQAPKPYDEIPMTNLQKNLYANMYK